MNTPSLLKITSAGLLLATSAAAQTTLINDSFTSVVVNGSGSTQTATSGAQTYQQLVNSNLFSGSVDSLSFSTTGNSIGFVQFSPTTLANTGDYISLSFTVTYAGTPASGSSALRFGLYNTLGDINTAKSYNATTNPQGDTAKGYYASLNPGDTGAAWSAGSNNLSKDLGNMLSPFNSVLGGAAGSTVALASTASAVTFGATTQSISLTLTKTANGISLSGSFAGETISATDVNGQSSGGNNGTPYTTFDTFFFGNGVSVGAWSMDNLVVTTTGSAIPEPGSAALLAGGFALACVATMRRPRRVR